MSYILDALKKAEAERRGTTPPATPAPTTYYGRAQRDPAWQKPWPWALLSAAVVTIAGATWFATRSDQPVQAPSPETPQAVAQAPVTPVAPQAPAPVMAQTAPPAATPPAPPPPPSAPAKAEAPPAPAAAPAATHESQSEAPQARPEKPARKPVEKKPAREPEASKKSAPATAPATPAHSPAATTSTTPAAEPAVGSVRDLPPQIQQQIPALTIGGYIYSANKADRSVLINKRLLRDGDEIAPGLTLERMTPGGMILNYKGYRYRSAY